MKKTIVAIVVAAVAGIAVTAVVVHPFGKGGAASKAAPDGWVAENHILTEWAGFLSWTENEGVFTGMSYFAEDVGPPTRIQVSQEAAAVTGVVHGTNVTLTVDVADGTKRTVTGTMSNGYLDLLGPAPDGTLRHVLYQPGCIERYNHLVADMQAEANGQHPQHGWPSPCPWESNR